MNFHTNPNWISADVQAHIGYLPIILIKAVIEDMKGCNIIKINICWNLALSASEAYELKVATFKNGKPEEFLVLMKRIKTSIDGAGTTSVSGRITYIQTMLREESIQKIDDLASQNNGMANAHSKFIQ